MQAKTWDRLYACSCKRRINIEYVTLTFASTYASERLQKCFMCVHAGQHKIHNVYTLASVESVLLWIFLHNLAIHKYASVWMYTYTLVFKCTPTNTHTHTHKHKHTHTHICRPVLCFVLKASDSTLSQGITKAHAKSHWLWTAQNILWHACKHLMCAPASTHFHTHRHTRVHARVYAGTW